MDKVKQMRQKQQGEAERQIEEDRERFPKFDEEKIKAMLLSDEEFRRYSIDPQYKNDIIKSYGQYNYALIQKCSQEIERDEKERIRQESIQRVNMGY